MEKLRIDYGNTHVFLSSRKKVTLDLEMDQDEPEDMLVTIRNDDYFGAKQSRGQGSHC